MDNTAQLNGLQHSGSLDIELSDLIDINALQKLLDSFFSLTSMPTAILTLDGEILAKSGWGRKSVQTFTGKTLFLLQDV